MTTKRLTPARFVALYELVVNTHKGMVGGVDKRSLAALVDGGLIEQSGTTEHGNPTYRATPAGRSAARAHLDYLEAREAKGRMFRSDNEQGYQTGAVYYRTKLDEMENRPVVKAAPTTRRIPSDWWTITSRSDTELVRVYGESMQDATEAARQYPEVREASQADGGFQLRRLYEDELTDEVQDDADEVPALYELFNGNDSYPAWARPSVPLTGAVVQHQDAGSGVAPRHSTNPDAAVTVAALRLAGHTPARVPADYDEDPEVTGFLVEPRGDGWVYVYHVHQGETAGVTGEWYTRELNTYADALQAAGFTVDSVRRCARARVPAPRK
ncbi:hypothetical protein [Nocardiopsis alba]|uniref:hypothetical protein n=1 Tax=Nocardiopsis alba TaxID=53437 RepID=UPI003D711D8D